MITCRKCKFVNPPEAENCEQCGMTLLPGESFSDRLTWFIGGIVGFGISLGMTYFLSKNPELVETSVCCLFTNPMVWLIGVVAFPILGLVSALRKTPIYKRYENRAQRHYELDWEQAVADLSEAISLAPKKYQAGLIKQRAEIFKTHGREQDYLRDRLTYMESEGAYEGQANLAQTFRFDSDSFVASVRNTERGQLIASGKIKAVGFCKKCQGSVELNEKSKCSIHPRIKPIFVAYVLPENLTEALQKAEEEGSKKLKKIKRTRLLVLIILAVIFVACILIPLAANFLPKLLGG